MKLWCVSPELFCFDAFKYGLDYKFLLCYSDMFLGFWWAFVGVLLFFCGFFALHSLSNKCLSFSIL